MSAPLLRGRCTVKSGQLCTGHRCWAAHSRRCECLGRFRFCRSRHHALAVASAAASALPAPSPTPRRSLMKPRASPLLRAKVRRGLCRGSIFSAGPASRRVPFYFMCVVCLCVCGYSPRHFASYNMFSHPRRRLGRTPHGSPRVHSRHSRARELSQIGCAALGAERDPIDESRPTRAVRASQGHNLRVYNASYRRPGPHISCAISTGSPLLATTTRSHRDRVHSVRSQPSIPSVLAA